MEFIKDCLSRELTLLQVACKWNISIDEVLPKYLEEKAKYTQDEIDKVMEEVYYGNN